jgi:hypothetical protein
MTYFLKGTALLKKIKFLIVKILLAAKKNPLSLCPLKNDGFVAERLGTGLQNLLQRFESARNLKTKALRIFRGAFLFSAHSFVL